MRGLLHTFIRSTRARSVSARYYRTTMSWMDSCSRPSKSSATPPPFYLTAGGENTPYCHTCGRLISSRKIQSGNVIVKYCSDRCRNRKPGPTDRKIEGTFAALLQGEEVEGEDGQIVKSLNASKAGKKSVKGDHRVLVDCSTVEELVFGSRHDPEKVFGRRKNRATRVIGGGKDGEWKSVDMEDTDGTAEIDSVDEGSEDDGGAPIDDPDNKPGPMIRPPQEKAEVNGSIGGEKGWAERKEETQEELDKRRAGQRRAEEREMVRRAARRAVAFGLKIQRSDDDSPEMQTGKKSKRMNGKDDLEGKAGVKEHFRKCEAVMNGSVVESSFAKGDWAIRWREKF